MIESLRSVLRAMSFRELEGRLVRNNRKFSFGFVYSGIAFLLTLFSFSSSGVAAASKDPSLRVADATSRSVRSSEWQRSGRPMAGHGLSASRKSTTVQLGSQLKQLENKTSKATDRTQLQAKSSNRAVPTRALISRGDKINFRQPPVQKNGMSNQQGAGSGSRRYGPGRRVTEKSP